MLQKLSATEIKAKIKGYVFRAMSNIYDSFLAKFSLAVKSLLQFCIVSTVLNGEWNLK